MIYLNEPIDWKDLQQKVCDVLRVCGCDASVEKTIETVRGKVDVDVHAIDPSISPSLTYLCECKYWNTAVPKNVVHGFRTVMSDYGAHVGFIISRSGFQSGAYEAAGNSNIKLVNWFEFQSLFEDRWKEARYASLRQLFEDLFEFYDYLSAPIGNAISGREDRMSEYSSLLKKYSPQADVNPWNRMIEPRKFPPALPHRVVESGSNGVSTEIVFEDYSSLFDWHERQTRKGLGEFNEFVSKYRTGPVGT